MGLRSLMNWRNRTLPIARRNPILSVSLTAYRVILTESEKDFDNAFSEYRAAPQDCLKKLQKKILITAIGSMHWRLLTLTKLQMSSLIGMSF